jgi:hypothetical protein
MVRASENFSSILNSSHQKSKELAKIFKKVFNNCKNAGLCNQYGKLRDHD